MSEKTPPPALESIFEDVYQRPPWHLQEQRAELLRGPRAPSRSLSRVVSSVLGNLLFDLCGRSAQDR